MTDDDTGYDRENPPEPSIDNYSWANTGNLNSRDHIARIELYQNKALCGTYVAGLIEIRPVNPRTCPKCARALRARGFQPEDVGIENDLTAERTT